MRVNVFLSKIVCRCAGDHKGSPAEPYGAHRVHGDQRENVDVTDFGSDQSFLPVKTGPVNNCVPATLNCKAREGYLRYYEFG